MTIQANGCQKTNKPMIDTTYYIDNSGRKKKFDTLEEAQWYVTEKRLVPDDGTSTIKIVKTETSVTHMAMPVTEILIELKKELIDKILEGLEYCLYYESHHLARAFGKISYGDKCTDKLDEMLDAAHLKIGTFKYGLPSSQTAPILNKSEEVFKKWVGWIKENVDTLPLRFIKVITDYTPCHGYGLNFGNSNYLLLREDSVVFSQHKVWGRNVNHSGTYILTEKDFVKVRKCLSKKDNV